MTVSDCARNRTNRALCQVGRRWTAQMRQRRSGVVLILVTVVIVMLSLAGLTFVMTLATEHKAISIHGDELQLQQILESGVELMATFAEQPPATRRSAGGDYDNPDLFRGAVVLDDEAAARQGRATVLSPRWDNDEIVGVRYGWENESGRLNLAVLPEWDQRVPDAGKRALMCLPGMTESVADKILDWVDADDTVRPGGAERQQYADQQLPYAPRNGCPARIDELLLIREAPRSLLLGRDLNADYRLSARETGGRAERIGSSATGRPPPWASLLTLYSAEQNLNPLGQPRVDLNDPNLQQLHARLSAVVDAAWAEFIILYRQFGQAPGGRPLAAANASPAARPPRPDSGIGTPGQRAAGRRPPSSSAKGQPPAALGTGGRPPVSARTGGRPAGQPGGGGLPASSAAAPRAGANAVPLDFGLPGRFPITSVLDLIGARVMLLPPLTPKPQIVESPFASDVAAMGEYLPRLLDETTVIPDSVIRGRVDVNTATRAVLRAVPGMDERMVEAIVANRNGAEVEERRHPTWLLTEGLLSIPQMEAVLPYLTCGGQVYRAQVIGYFSEGRPVARAEVVIDATVTPPRPACWTDLRSRGRGFSREEL